MPTYALEGTGARITFATSLVTADLLRLTLPERTRDKLETTHLRSLITRTSKPTRLLDPGTVAVELDHVPTDPPLIKRPPEKITVEYPLRPGMATPDKLEFQGYVIAEGIGAMQVGKRITTALTIAVTSDYNVIPGQDEIRNAAISPVLERFWHNPDGTYTALWGWYSRNTVNITVPIPLNRFHPDPQDRGQPTVFTPGRQYGMFTTTWPGGNLVWTLVSPDGSGRTATAGAPPP